MNAFNKDLTVQIRALESILKKSPIISEALKHAEGWDFPHWHLGAGCIAQTVWNHLSDKEPAAHIKDLDLAYFDPHDLTKEREARHEEEANVLFKEIPIEIDVKNQARVHLWYEGRFGRPIEPYPSIEAAINSWPTTATCIGVRTCREKFTVYAPYGLNDLFGMVARPNKVQITEAIYMKKVNRWKTCWPKLEIVPW
jgi:hypothetical protein